jgi:beta-glucosidase
VPASAPAVGVPTPRVRRLLAAMSREDKVAIIRGAREPAGAAQGEAGWTRGVPRLGIPDLRFADGPPGVLVHHPSTGMPSTLSMAATFSPDDAEATGALIGRDARALGIDVILQPYINLYRDPTFERAYNTLGEDPVLTGTLAARFVLGAQAQNVMAQAKHFVAYEGGDDARVDGQALREIYLAPFADVSRAGVASIMCAYNRVNGVYACDDEFLLNGILRGEDGFAGFVTSDWGAAHGADFMLHGMDMEQPGIGPSAFFALGPEPEEPAMTAEETAQLQDTLATGAPEEQRFPPSMPSAAAAPPSARRPMNLGEALAQGSVSDADLDHAVAHVLGQMERFGWLDRRPSHQVRAQAIAANARGVQRLAERGAVLLKNDGVLPLRAADLSSLALIGPGALQTFAIVNGEEQSYGRAARQIGAWQALRAAGLGKGVNLAVADDMTGEPIPKRVLAPLMRSDEHGQASVPEKQIDFTRKSGQALPAGTRARWDGTLMIPAEGDYDIDLQLLGATGKFWIDRRKVGDMGWWGGHGDIVFPNRDNVVPTTDGLDNVRRLVHLSAGPHALRVEAAADGSGAPVQVRLAWVTPSMRERSFSAAVALAARSKVAVVFAWSRNRPVFGLPGDQDRLIEAVARVNPNTVVVLNTGQAVAMPWLNNVRAVIEMWYTGDEGGWAAANLLIGRANPGGRLPITWPVHLEDYAAMNPRFPERLARGAGRTDYGEGVHVGYRWFDREGIEPLFPFGHGLSYSTFVYSDLRLAHSADGGVTVRCRVRNASRRAGDAVVQVYLGVPAPAPAGAEFAARALAAFARVRIAAGGAREVRLQIAPQRLRYWSLSDQAWHTLARGGRRVFVGASSRDLPLSAPIAPDGADSVDR